MRFLFPSPFGNPPPCPVDDAPHTTCTSGGPIVISQLPARDALAEVLPAPPPKPAAPKLRAEEIQERLGPNEFTTGTYRGKKGRR